MVADDGVVVAAAAAEVVVVADDGVAAASAAAEVVVLADDGVVAAAAAAASAGGFDGDIVVHHGAGSTLGVGTVQLAGCDVGAIVGSQGQRRAGSGSPQPAVSLLPVAVAVGSSRCVPRLAAAAAHRGARIGFHDHWPFLEPLHDDHHGQVDHRVCPHEEQRVVQVEQISRIAHVSRMCVSPPAAHPRSPRNLHQRSPRSPPFSYKIKLSKIRNDERKKSKRKAGPRSRRDKNQTPEKGFVLEP